MDSAKEIRRRMLAFQRNEITEYHVYLLLARAAKSPQNRQALERIANDELEHSRFWEGMTGEAVRPSRLSIWKHYLISRLLGLTFGCKLMEKGEGNAQRQYERMRDHVPEVDELIRSEAEHEHTILGFLDEQRLRYTGSIVLGLSDALVELTGALAGLTLALRNNRLIALTGLITGIAAAMSMAASEYLSTKAEGTTDSPFRAAFYTGSAYIVTVLLLVVPYLFLGSPYWSLGCTMGTAILIIAVFNSYMAVATDMSFRSRFLEMAGLCVAVASLSFLVGYLVRAFLGVDV
ncbi:MAG: VIT1/CCC1 transporter family protein [Candidatus Latescibacteria bacterium]|jgi:VIT1/CCC1 family predicted Fe2+/Mn2+ transporter|nr:VIT1/CCC1 transporter family protein [Candidatus Latescibacterota bacterium]